MNFKIIAIVLTGIIAAGTIFAPELFEQPRIPPSSTPRTSTSSIDTISTKGRAIETSQDVAPLVHAPKGTPLATTTPPAPANVTLIVDGTRYTGYIPSSSTVLELMQSLASTSALVFTGREYTSLGFFVETLNGKRASDGYVWILYVNGKKSSEGVSTLRISPNDTVEWKYEKSY